MHHGHHHKHSLLIGAKIQLFPYLLHIAISFERKPMVIHGGEVPMNIHEMDFHMLTMKSHFLRAPN